MHLLSSPQFASHVIYADSDGYNRALASVDLIANGTHTVVDAANFADVQNALKQVTNPNDTFVLTTFKLPKATSPNGNDVVQAALNAGIPKNHIAFYTGWAKEDCTPDIMFFDKARKNLKDVLAWIAEQTKTA
jgi:hypothetical protein